MLIDFSIHDRVLVKLNEKGLQVLENKNGGIIPDWYDEMHGRKNGMWEFYIWEFMRIFGEFMYDGPDLPFDETIRICSGKTFGNSVD